MSVTWYDQVAEDLITSVTVATSPVITTQSVNVGKVSNRGLEIEASVRVNPVRFRAQYAYTRSRILELGPDGVPGLVIGGQPTQIPAHTGGVTATGDLWLGGSVAVGANYVGSYRAVDIVSEIGCFAGNLPCPDPPTFTNFIRSFPGFVKVNLSVTQQLTPQVEALLTVNNLTDNTKFESLSVEPVIGRITQLGLHARF
jgi:outer membrane receptor protein involved in Fe transport